MINVCNIHIPDTYLIVLYILGTSDDVGVDVVDVVDLVDVAGADVETRQEIFEQLLPEETFVDRRLMTEAMVIGMVGALSTE